MVALVIAEAQADGHRHVFTDNISRLSWFDREGRELDSIPTIGFSAPSLSRNGTQLAASSERQASGGDATQREG